MKGVEIIWQMINIPATYEGYTIEPDYKQIFKINGLLI